MARMHKWFGIATLAFSLTGCVSAEQYSAMKLSRDQAVEQLNQAEADAKSARSQADAYKAQRLIDWIFPPERVNNEPQNHQ